MIPQKKLAQLASQALRQCREWNDRCPAGTLVSFAGSETKTTGKAFELFGNAYVPIEGQRQAVSLHLLTPLEEPAHGH